MTSGGSFNLCSCCIFASARMVFGLGSDIARLGECPFRENGAYYLINEDGKQNDKPHHACHGCSAERGLAPMDAASLGAFLHGLAGDVAAERLSEYSLIASDIIDAIPVVLSSVQNKE